MSDDNSLLLQLGFDVAFEFQRLSKIKMDVPKIDAITVGTKERRNAGPKGSSRPGIRYENLLAVFRSVETGLLRVCFRHIFPVLGFPVITGSLFVIHARIRVHPHHPATRRRRSLRSGRW
jgi:hypothetical protein